MIKLFEDFKNLNMIDRSLLSDAQQVLKDASITPNSKIEVNRVTPHRFTTVMEILSEENVAGVVVRAHNRQLMLVLSGRDTMPSRFSYYDYLVILTDYAESISNHGYSKFLRTDKETQVKTAISRVVKSFYDRAPEGTKKKWDILVIYKDENVSNIRKDRIKRQSDIVLTPKDKNYANYIHNLELAFQKRVTDYIDSKRPNITNTEEFKDFLLNNIKINKIKFKGEMFKFYDENIRMMNGNRVSYIEYQPVEDSARGSLYVILKFNGIKPEIVGIKYTPYRYTSVSDAEYID